MKPILSELSKKLNRSFKNMSLKRKMFSIVLVNVTMLLLFFLFGFHILTHTYNELLYRSVAGNLSFSSQSLSTNFKDIERLSSIILSASSIQDSLSAIHDTDDAVVWSNANRSINNALSSYYETFKQNGVSYILLFNDGFSNTTNWSAYHKTDQLFLDTARTNADNADGAISWTVGASVAEDRKAAADFSGNGDDRPAESSSTKDSRSSGIILGRNIRRIKEMDFTTIGQLLIHVDIERLINTVNRSSQSFETAYYVLSDGDSPIYISDGISEELAVNATGIAANAYQTLTFDGHTYFAVSSKIPSYDWKYVSLIPFDAITTSVRRSIRVILVILVLVLLVTLLLTQWLIYSIIRHFNALIGKMDDFSKNELTLAPSSYDYSARNDEIGTLHQRFDRMALRIRTLVDTNYRNELLRKEAQLKALESQINPHFLYNTLESINWRAKASKNAEISMMAESLGTLLRSTLSNKDSLVTLKYELDLVQAYMTIQKIRFEDRLDFTWSVDEGLDQILIPPLSIQPLIENAIRYGMEEMTETCHVELLVRHIDDQVFIKVKNNGSMFEDDLLESLRNKSRQPNGFGIGLLNIDHRIRLLFGNACGLMLKNENDCATAEIYIPYQIKGEEIHAEDDYCR